MVLNISSAENTVVTQVYLHNAAKNSWLQVYEGRRDVSSVSQELYRLYLAPNKYDKIKVVSSSGEKVIDKEVNIQNGSSLIVDIGL